MRRNPLIGILTGLGAMSLIVSACGSGDDSDAGGTGDGGAAKILMWTHSAGNEEELATINEIIADFNASQDSYEVVQEAFPQGAYNDAITAAAVSGDLPCLLDMDGPIVPNWAWAGYVQPLDLPDALVDPLLPSAKSYWQNELYAVGYWDVTIAMYTRESILDAHDIRVPTLDQPWSGEEFNEALEKLAASGEFEYPLELGTGWSGEWWPYAFSPSLQSFGGDLIDRSTYLSADGALNGRDAVEWGEWFQGLFSNGYADPQGSEGREAFAEGSTAISWNGSWAAPEALETFDDALILPPPDFGNGVISGGASWQWGVSSSCDQTEGAMEYLEFSLDPAYIAAFSDRIGLIPASAEAAAMSENYSAGAPLEFFYDYAEDVALVRPETPAYAVISSVFEKAAKDIMNGANVQGALDRAVTEIDTNIDSNDSYGF